MHLLVIRLSAMGDVAMTIPVLNAALEQNPNLELTVLSNPNYACLFNFSDRIHFRPVDTKVKYKGLKGIRKLFKELKQESSFDAVADLHGVLRSFVLGGMFRLSGVKLAKIDKGRAEKAQLTQKNKKHLTPVKHSSQRYADVLKALGVSFIFDEKELKQVLFFNEAHHQNLNTKNIALAPFAQHEGKTYPLSKIKELVNQLSKNSSLNIYLYGGGEKEEVILSDIASKYANVVSVAKGFSLEQQLSLLKELDLMISMDSANMHFASLMGVKAVSVWGATHFYAGFLGIGQSENNVVEISTDELSCRPCSVFGSKPCFREDYACMNLIKPESIVNKIELNISD